MITSGVFALPYDDSAGFTAPPAFGTFRVLHQIGSGALGPVFRAFEPQHERLIAIKAFRLDIVPEVTATLADALRRLAATPVDSDRVIPAVDAGLEGMTAYLASEYVTSDTLDVAVKRMAPATLDRAMPILRQVAEAIEAAWQAGLGHGALHPRDVFVAPDTMEVRVGGFGVVAVLEKAGIKLPPRRPYTAPERIAGQPWDIRADVFSLGVLAHELLTGRRPSGGGEQDGALPTGTTPEQRVAIRRALSDVLFDDPQRRYATPSEFIAALETGDAPEQQTLFGVVGPQQGDDVIEPLLIHGPLINDAPRGVTEPAIEEVDEEEDEQGEEEDEVAPTPFQIDAAEIRLAPVAPPLVAYLPPHATPRLSGAAIGAIALLMGVAFGCGYWLRGVPPVTPAALETAAADTDQPIGTEVPVTGTASPSAPPAQATPVASVSSAPVTRGRLLVRSVPSGARVLISGRSRGTTPATVRDLPFGTYNVTVSRDGYRTQVQRVTLSRQQPARDITVDLAPTAAAASTTATTGSVYIDTRPTGAQVTMDGRVVGTAPMRIPNLTPG